MNHRNPPLPDGQRSTAPTAFLTKTYQLVDDHCVDHIISWTSDGSTFVVWRPGDFAQELLPHKFKHNNFTSFIRQINSYSFRKISQDRWEFAHEFFRRGEDHLLGRIDRRRRSSGAASTSSSNEPVLTSDSTTELMEENELLKRENARLTSENVQMKSLCDRIRRLVLNSGTDSGGGEGRTLEEEVAAAISGREGSQNTEAQLGSRRALMEKGTWLEDSEIQPSTEEELSLQLSLSHVPRKRASDE